MNFLFRVDAGGETGLGHYYRSLSLADLLSKKGHQIIYLHQPSSFWDEIKKTNFSYNAFEINLDESINELKIINNYNIDVLFVDGIIEFEEEYIKHVKNYAKVVFYQNLSISRYLADVFIIPSIHQDKDFFEVFSKQTKIYQGLEYFTFNPSISLFKTKKIDRIVGTVGITTGGSDPKNTLLRIYDMIDFKKFNKLNFIFFYGNDYMHKDQLTHFKQNNVSIKKFNHQKIMECDLLISAFGVSTYEFMSRGMPIITFGHQESNATASKVLANKTQSVINLGSIDDFKSSILNSKLKDLVDSYKLRKNLSTSAKSLLDLKGINRVSKILEEIYEE